MMVDVKIRGMPPMVLVNLFLMMEVGETCPHELVAKYFEQPTR